MKELTLKEATDLGYDRKIFEEYTKTEVLKNTLTYQDFIRDDIDFAFVTRGKKSNLYRKQRDYAYMGGVYAGKIKDKKQ